MLKFAKVLAVALTLGGAIALAPTAALAQHHHHWRGGGGWGYGPGFALGFGLGAAPYYGYYGGPYAYAGDCGWMRVRTYYGWRRVWRCW